MQAPAAPNDNGVIDPSFVYVRRGRVPTVWRIASDRFVHRGTSALRVSQTSWGRRGNLRALFSARTYFSSQEGDSADPNADACRLWLPHANTISVISSYHDEDVAADRHPPHNVAATAWLVRVQIFNEFFGDVGESFYWQLDYYTCRKIVQYLRILEPNSTLRRPDCIPTPEILNPLHYAGSLRVLSTGEDGWSPAATLLLLSVAPAPNPSVKTMNGDRWRNRAALAEADGRGPDVAFGGWTSCTDRVDDASPTTTALVLAPPSAAVVANRRTRGTTMLKAAWTRDANEWAKRRDARDPFEKLPHDMLRLVAGHLLDSSTGSDWSAVLALRATCRTARTIVDVRAADLVLDAHDIVADCISDPIPLARVIAGGRRLMRAGLFAPAVLRELAAARDANAQTYRSEAGRVERAHALFLQLGRLRTHRPPSAKPPRPLASARRSRSPSPLRALKLVDPETDTDSDLSRAPLTPISNPSPTAHGRAKRRKRSFSARELASAPYWDVSKRERPHSA